MRKFDPWGVFFKREFNRNWPFLVGFAVTGTIITKMSLGLTGQYPIFISRRKIGRTLSLPKGTKSMTYSKP
ncbi:hypothetical protein CTI12_AA172560 [Artemisia annua]|uniref:Uncharacterized protein n=1 Tax=Artemisia annua TaxID=35608 RepID=A0A2U1PBD0_ARTAN|nr:hypothetical protein CTI12_AA172560 [Artemisia annua]